MHLSIDNLKAVTATIIGIAFFSFVFQGGVIKQVQAQHIEHSEMSQQMNPQNNCDKGVCTEASPASCASHCFASASIIKIANILPPNPIILAFALSSIIALIFLDNTKKRIPTLNFAYSDRKQLLSIIKRE